MGKLVEHMDFLIRFVMQAQVSDSAVRLKVILFLLRERGGEHLHKGNCVPCF